MPINMNKYQEIFLSEAYEHLDALDVGLIEFEKSPFDEKSAAELMRHAHTFKGIAASMKYGDISNLSHSFEGMVENIKNAEQMKIISHKKYILMTKSGCDFSHINFIIENKEGNRVRKVFYLLLGLASWKATQWQPGLMTFLKFSRRFIVRLSLLENTQVTWILF